MGWMLKRGMICTGVALALVLCFAGCSPVTYKAAEERVESALAADGTLELASINGRIEFLAWNEPKVLVKTLKSVEIPGGVHLPWDAAMLDSIKITEAGDSRSRSFTTQWDGTWSFGRSVIPRVDYYVKVPATAKVRIKIADGSVFVRNLAADTYVDVVNGAIDAQGLVGKFEAKIAGGTINAVYAAAFKASDQLICNAETGSITAILPKGSSFELSARAVEGSVISKTYEAPQREDFSGGMRFFGKVGLGGGPVDLQSGKGDITIKADASE